MNELVSIITASYNTAKFISQTIESVLAQTYTNWEMIIVDDCSTDETDQIVKPYLLDSRIKYLKNKKNSGAALSRNYALREVNGQWVAFLDSDDLWDITKLEKQIEFMRKHNYYFSYTNYREIDENGVILNTCITGPSHINKRKMYQYCWPGCLTVMYNTNIIGLIQIDNLKKNNDYAIWLKAILKTNCFLFDETLSSYRKRGGSISNIPFYKLIKYHYILFKQGEHKSTPISILLAIQNLIFGLLKKIKYK